MNPLIKPLFIASALLMSPVFAVEVTGERVIAVDTRTDIIVLPALSQLDGLSDADLARLVQALGGDAGVALNDSSRAATRLRARRTRFLRAELIRIEARSLNNPFNINDPVNNAFVNNAVLAVAADDVDALVPPPVEPPVEPPIEPPIEPPVEPPIEPQIPFGTEDFSQCDGVTTSFGLIGARANRQVNIVIDQTTLICQLILGDVEDIDRDLGSPLGFVSNRSGLIRGSRVPGLGSLTARDGAWKFTQTNRRGYSPFDQEVRNEFFIFESTDTDVEIHITVTLTPHPDLVADPSEGLLAFQVTVDSIVRVR